MLQKPVVVKDTTVEKQKNVQVQTIIDLSVQPVRINLACGNCGEMPDRIGAKFCANCGSELKWDHIFVKTKEDDTKSDGPTPQEDTVEDPNAPVHKA